MVRVIGMIGGIGLLVIASGLGSPAVAWDHDDDDDDYKKRRYYPAPVVRYPVPRYPVYAPPRYVEQHDYHRGGIVAPPRYVEQHDHYQGGILAPPAPVEQGPIVPAPLPPSAIEQGYQYPQAEQYVAPPAPPVNVLPYDRPGQFLDVAVPLYPFVRVKDRDNAPRFGVNKILAVQSPDPFRFPGCVYVQVCVPPGPCRGVKVKDGGAKIELDYGEYEVEVTSNRGVITVDYDD